MKMAVAADRWTYINKVAGSAFFTLPHYDTCKITEACQTFSAIKVTKSLA